MSPLRIPLPVSTLLVIASLLFASAGLEAQDRRIDSDEESIRQLPSVASLDGGSNVFVWAELFPDQILMRRFDSAGAPLDDAEVPVEGAQSRGKSDVAASGQGEFVIVWSDYTYGGLFLQEIQGRRFADDGTPLGDVFQVNQYTSNDQHLPAVAMREDGSFLVVWQSGGNDGSQTGIGSRNYDSTGAPVGGEMVVNITSSGFETFPDVAVGPSGEAIAVWRSDSTPAIHARRFDSAGTPVGEVVVVSPELYENVPRPAVAKGTDDTFLVVWDDRDESSFGIFGRLFDSDGNALGEPVTISENTASTKNRADVATDPVSGEFLVVWQSREQAEDPVGYGAFARRVSPAGTPLAGETLINTDTTSDQRDPAVAFQDSGEDIVTWSAIGPKSGIFANIPTPPEIFEDGFEDGSLDAWTSPP